MNFALVDGSRNQSISHIRPHQVCSRLLINRDGATATVLSTPTYLALAPRRELEVNVNYLRSPIIILPTFGAVQPGTRSLAHSLSHLRLQSEEYSYEFYYWIS